MEELLEQLEERMLWRPWRNLILHKRIHSFAEAIIGLKEKEYLGNTQPGTLLERIQPRAEYILQGLEEKYGIGDRALSAQEHDAGRNQIHALTEHLEKNVQPLLDHVQLERGAS